MSTINKLALELDERKTSWSSWITSLSHDGDWTASMKVGTKNFIIKDISPHMFTLWIHNWSVGSYFHRWIKDRYVVVSS